MYRVQTLFLISAYVLLFIFSSFSSNKGDRIMVLGDSNGEAA